MMNTEQLDESGECSLCGGTGEVQITPYGQPDSHSDVFGCPACIQKDRDAAEQERDQLQQLVDAQVKDIGNGMAVLHRVRKERNELLDWMRHIHAAATDIGVERKAIAMAASKAIAVVEGRQCDAPGKDTGA